jgi:uncharacterized membrane protein
MEYLRGAADISFLVPLAGSADFAAWAKAIPEERVSGYATTAVRSSAYRKDDERGMEANKAYRRWKRLMILGSKSGCHQKAERSFFIRGYQFPVCARCSGVILGYLSAIPAYLLTGFHLFISLAGCLAIFGDWLLQQKGIRESNNYRRVVTGFLGGFGVMSLQLHIITRFLSLFIRR